MLNSEFPKEQASPRIEYFYVNAEIEILHRGFSPVNKYGKQLKGFSH